VSAHEHPRILLSSHNSNLSGAPISLAQLAKGLAIRNFSLLLVLPKPGPIEKLLKQWNVTYVVLKRPNAVIDFLRIARRFKPDVIHVNSLVKMWPVLVSRCVGKQVVWHVREYLGNKRAYARLIHLLAHRVILISKQQVQLFQGMKRAVVVPNAVDLTLYENVLPADDIRTATSDIIVCYIGSIEPRKGLIELARAAHHLENVPNIYFVIAGDAPRKHMMYKQELVDYLRENSLLDRFRFLGFRQDVPRVLRASDMLCHPVYIEAFGRVVIEAMASKLPVIASRVGEIPSIVENGKTGFLVDPGDHRGIADALLRVAENKALKNELGRNGYERVKKRFGLDTHVEKIVEVYSGLLKR
jgi:glycosyltransferase involved in cell wall biosynthesis